MPSPFSTLALSLKHVADNADKATTSVKKAGEEAGKYADLIKDFKFASFVGGGVDIGQAVGSQQDEIALILQSKVGEALKKYAQYSKLLAEPGVTPQMATYFQEWMILIEKRIRQYGGQAGSTFNFNTFRTEIQNFVRNQQKLLKQQESEQRRRERQGSKSGALGRESAPAGSSSLSILRAIGGLP